MASVQLEAGPGIPIGEGFGRVALELEPLGEIATLLVRHLTLDVDPQQLSRRDPRLERFLERKQAVRPIRIEQASAKPILGDRSLPIPGAGRDGHRTTLICETCRERHQHAPQSHRERRSAERRPRKSSRRWFVSNVRQGHARSGFGTCSNGLDRYRVPADAQPRSNRRSARAFASWEWQISCHTCHRCASGTTRPPEGLRGKEKSPGRWPGLDWCRSVDRARND